MDRSIVDPDAFIQTDVVGTYTLLEVAREAGLRYHQVSTDEVYGHVPVGERRRDRSPRAPLALLGQQGLGRPAGERLPRHLRVAHDDHPRLEQHRSLPVPGEGAEPVRHQRHRRPAAAGVRRRPAGAGLPVGRRPLRGHRPGAGAWAPGRGVQRGHRHLHHQPGDGGDPAGGAGQARVAHPARDGSAGPRSALRPGHHAAARSGLGAGPGHPRGDPPGGAVVCCEPVVVGAHQVGRLPRSTTSKTTATGKCSGSWARVASPSGSLHIGRPSYNRAPCEAIRRTEGVYGREHRYHGVRGRTTRSPAASS